MKARVDSFIADGGKPEYNRRIYLDSLPKWIMLLIPLILQC